MEKRKSLLSKTAKRRLRRFWKEFRPTAVLMLSLLIVFLVARFAVTGVVDMCFEPVDRSDATPIEVTVPAASSASSIARILYGACGYEQQGLIRSTAVFKVYVDFLGKANSLKAGTYVLSKNMSTRQIVDALCEGNPPRATVTFTIPEGYTVSAIAAVLRQQGLIGEDVLFTAACKSGEAYTSFDFVSAVVNGAGADRRSCELEGYLFPDTYEVYTDASVDTVITKMLNRFNEVFTDEYVQRAKTLGLSVDQAVILASLIEREAQAEGDFAKVSAVFHNRLKEDMLLQSCASLSYALGQNKYTFTDTELKTESPYNTYQHKGLPVGPVCNPGKAALEAALNPNEEYLDQGYLYFCNGNLTESTELVFAKTYEEHQQNVKKYQQYWG